MPETVMAAPTDRSLEAFKAWVTSIAGVLGGDDDDDMTDDEWQQFHRDFWAPDPPKKAQEPIRLGGPGSGNWGHVGVPGVRGGSQPGAGGPENRQRSINRRLAVQVGLSIKDREVEYAAVITPDGEIPVEVRGDKLNVYWPSDKLHLLKDAIMVHNHVVLDGGQFGPGPGDMEFAGGHDPAEMIVVTPDYVHSIPRPEDGWGAKYTYNARDNGPNNPYSMTLQGIFQDYRSVNGAYEVLEQRYSEDQLSDMTRGQKEAELRHILWQRIAEQTGVQYTRTRMPTKAPVIPQLGESWQFGSFLSGNWSHTGLEDVHGGSDPGGGLGTPEGRTARFLKLTEDRIVRSPAEIAVCIDPATGSQVFAYTGDENSVHIPSSAVPSMRDKIFTHNHPPQIDHYSGPKYDVMAPPGETDVKAARIADVAEMRVITDKWTFSISRPPGDAGWDKFYAAPADPVAARRLGIIPREPAGWRVHSIHRLYLAAHHVVTERILESSAPYGSDTVRRMSDVSRHEIWKLVNKWTDGDVKYTARARHTDDVSPEVKQAKLDEGEHQLGSPSSGNWAHTGLEDLHGGSDPGGGVGTPAGRLARITKMTEDRIVRNPYETGVCIDPATGQQIFAYRGTVNSVAIPTEQRPNMKGMVFTHNHPSGDSFSKADFYVSRAVDVAEMRAVGEKYTYSIKRPETGWQLVKIDYDVEGVRTVHTDVLVRLIDDEVYKEQRHLVKQGELTNTEASNRHNHLVWTRLDRMCGGQFQYERKPRHSYDVQSTKQAKLDEGEHQLGGPGSGNWAHTGLEDLHGGSDPGGGVGTPEGRTARIIKMSEDRIVRSPVEIAVCVNPNTGEQVFAYTGSETSVHIPRAEAPNMKDMVFTHNHPSGTVLTAPRLSDRGPNFMTAPSLNDVIASEQVDVSELRVVTDRWTYSVSRPPGPDGWSTRYPVPAELRSLWGITAPFGTVYKTAGITQLLEGAYDLADIDMYNKVGTIDEMTKMKNTNYHRAWQMVNKWTNGEVKYEAKSRHTDDVRPEARDYKKDSTKPAPVSVFSSREG